jgi:uncharacterized delta-60 repeat protein
MTRLQILAFPGGLLLALLALGPAAVWISRRLLARRWRERRYALASAILLGVGVAVAAPGDLDPTFNGSGLSSLRIGDVASIATDIVQRSDGKIVLAGVGTLNVDGVDDFIAVQLAEDGTRDATFGTDGVAIADFGGSDDTALAVIQQRDGKLVLAGKTYSSDAAGDIALARFNVNGTLDATFGGDGRITLDLGGDDEYASGLIQQPGGKLVIAGATNATGSERLFLARFNFDGTLDTSFGGGGSTLVDYGGGLHCRAEDLAQQSDGKLVAVGAVSGPNTTDIAVVRLTANGTLDPLFSGDGMLAVDFNGGREWASSVAIQPDDVIVAAGISGSNAALVRINGNGTLDGGFGKAGKAVANLGSRSTLYSIVAQTDGKLVATGVRNRNGDGLDLILARFKSDGTLDTTYGVRGVATADFGVGAMSADSLGLALIQQVDGKYVAVGPNYSAGTFSVARFDDNAAYPGRIGLTATSQSVDETTAAVTYVVRRTGGKTGAVSVDFATEAGSAQPGSDFEDTFGTLNWTDGDAGDQRITVNLIDDALSERPENFSLSLSAPTGGAQLAASEATTSVSSQDGPGELRLLWPMTLSDEHYVPEGIGAITLPVVRLHGSMGTVSVQFHTNRGSATAGEDFAAKSGTLTWANGDTRAKSITVEILDDAVIEPVERFDVQISGPTGGATIGLGARQNVFIQDNEPGTAFIFSSQVTIVDEASGSALLVVSRIGAGVGAASVNFATSSETATAGSDFAAARGTLSWAARDSASKTISLDITNDGVDESDETLSVTLSNPSGAVLGSNSMASVIIVDDDPPPTNPPPTDPPPTDPPPTSGPSPTSPVPPTRSGGGQFGFLSLLLLGCARLLRTPYFLDRSRVQPAQGHIANGMSL